jgi:ketosteroid isomerase-like protein
MTTAAPDTPPTNTGPAATEAAAEPTRRRPNDPSPQDRSEVLEKHAAYLHANNTSSDSGLLRQVWDAKPRNLYYNMGGHPYRGVEHWSKLWDYYHSRVVAPIGYTSYDQRVQVRGDVAWVTCHRYGSSKWVAAEPRRNQPDGVKLSRSTEILLRQPDGWHTVHVHFSVGSSDPRPGGI